METLDSRLAALMEELQFVGDWNDRYRLLVEWGEEAVPLPESERTPSDEVAGCSSPLWLRVRWAKGVLEVQGASPGILPKALLAVVCRLFNGLEEVSGAAAEVMEKLEMKRHLSPTRALVLERMLNRALTCPRNSHD